MNKNILRLSYLIITCLVLLCVCVGLIPDYLSFIEKKGRQGEAAWLNDPRILEERKKIITGTVYDRHHRILIDTVPGTGEAEGQVRRYPLGESAAHLTGYSSTRYGLAGIEAGMSTVLAGGEGPQPLNRLRALFTGNELEGNSIRLTVDAAMQQKAWSLLNGRKGAIVAIDPRSGDILTMASSPSFDPNQIEANMEVLLHDQNSPLLNRASQGAYAPGSVFKIITLAAALEKNSSLTQKRYSCPGYIIVDGFKLNCTQVHGELDLERAFILSCNTTFASLGLEAGAKALGGKAREFGFDTGCDLPFDYYPGSLGGTNLKSAGPTDLASAAIGQGSVTANPMQIALAACAVANQGIIMQPRLVEEIMDPNGHVVHTAQSQKWLTAVQPGTADRIKGYMVKTVQFGTGSKASISGVRVAGKTGTAENAGKEPHAWFVGFAPAEEPRVVVAVIIENGGSGGLVAAPIAREIMNQALFG